MGGKLEENTVFLGLPWWQVALLFECGSFLKVPCVSSLDEAGAAWLCSIQGGVGVLALCNIFQGLGKDNRHGQIAGNGHSGFDGLLGGWNCYSLDVGLSESPMWFFSG